MDETSRINYLKAMGIELWQPIQSARSPEKGIAVDPATSAAGEYRTESPTPPLNEAVEQPEPITSIEKTTQPAVAATAPIAPAEPAIWQRLEQQVERCTACSLHQSRQQTVFGVGDHNASWMLIGEAPGASEDRQGEPFVGPAGQLLTEMLRAINLSREQVFITNILKCRPPNNRDPLPTEVAACQPFLEQQIELIKPDIILAVGRVAAHNLLKTDAPLSRLRGTIHRYLEIPLVVIYHPSYLLRQPREKAKAWHDLQLALTVL